MHFSIAELMEQDRELALFAAQNGTPFDCFVSTTWLADREIMLAVLDYAYRNRKDHWSLVDEDFGHTQFPRVLFRHDRDVLLSVLVRVRSINHHELIIATASAELFDDREFVLRLLLPYRRECCWGWIWVNCPTYVMHAVDDGFHRVSARLRNEDRAVAVTVLQKRCVFLHATMRWLTEDVFSFLTYRLLPLSWLDVTSHVGPHDVFDYPERLALLGENFRDDRALVLACVRADGAMLQHASEKLRDDPDVVAEALRHSPDHGDPGGPDADHHASGGKARKGDTGAVLRHASERLRDDPAIVKLAVSLDGTTQTARAALQYASARLRCCPELAGRAVACNANALSHTGGGEDADEESERAHARMKAVARRVRMKAAC